MRVLCGGLLGGLGVEGRSAGERRAAQACIDRKAATDRVGAQACLEILLRALDMGPTCAEIHLLKRHTTIRAEKAGRIGRSEHHTASPLAPVFFANGGQFETPMAMRPNVASAGIMERTTLRLRASAVRYHVALMPHLVGEDLILSFRALRPPPRPRAYTDQVVVCEG